MNIDTLNPKSLPILGICLAALYWLIDAGLDVYLFHIEQSFLQSIFTSNTNELWMRFSVAAILIVFSFYAKKSELLKITLTEEINELGFLETRDSTTLLFNKRKLYEILEYEMDKDKRYKRGLSVIFCSINNFKNMSELHDSHIMDSLLRSFSSQLIKILRTSDIVAHWNEEEFVIIIPNKTASETTIVAEKIQNEIAEIEFSDIGKITTNIGITQFVDNDNKVTIVERANNAHTKAKGKGINKIEVIV
jgi:diguanylate cyclase (GGDEF)-like protein